MDKGKEKCEILKAIRAYLAEKYCLDYTPSECNHRGKCRGTCPKCDAELEYLQKQLEKKGITDITNDTKLSKMVDDYLLKPTNDEEDGDMLVGVPDIPVDTYATEGMPKPLEGDVVIEEGVVPDQPLEGEVCTDPIEKRKLFLECNVAGAAFYNIDDIWDELYEGAKLVLVREKDNVHDEDAIAVALADESNDWSDEIECGPTLGYIPRKVNKALATLLDMGWQDVFETEISELRENVPYSDRIHISIYIKNKDAAEEKEPEQQDDRLRMVVITEEAKWELLSDELWQKGYTYFRWGGFPPWELDLPSKGDKVVFLYNDGFQSFMYLMKTIAIGEQSVPFLEDIDELHQVDDSTVYVLSNIVGPVIIDNSELKLPKELLKGKYQPDERVSQSLSDKLMYIFISHQYSTHINEL